MRSIETIVDGFFSGYDFGDAGDRADLAYQHYDEDGEVIVFRAQEGRIDEVDPLVAAATAVLARSYPECATLQYRIDARVTAIAPDAAR